MRCSITGTTTRPPGRCSWIAASVASGSNRRWMTAVDDVASAIVRWASPQAWNSGAATSTVSRARNGTSSNPLADAAEPGRRALRALGSPRRSRRQDDLAAGVAGRHQRHERALGGDLGERGAADRHDPVARRDGRVELVLVHDDGERLPLGDIGELRAGERRVEVDDVGADLRRAEQRLHELLGRCGRGSRPAPRARRRAPAAPGPRRRSRPTVARRSPGRRRRRPSSPADTGRPRRRTPRRSTDPTAAIASAARGDRSSRSGRNVALANDVAADTRRPASTIGLAIGRRASGATPRARRRSETT